MKTYEKMKAAIVDLSNVLDEALAFEEYKKSKLQPAFAGNVGGNIRLSSNVTSRGNDVGTYTTRGAAAPYASGNDIDYDGFVHITAS